MPKVEFYKYLGVFIDSGLKYDICVKSLAESANRALGACISKFKSLKSVGYDSFTKLYSIYEYGSGVWGHCKTSEITTVQNRYEIFSGNT